MKEGVVMAYDHCISHLSMNGMKQLTETAYGGKCLGSQYKGLQSIMVFSFLKIFILCIWILYVHLHARFHYRCSWATKRLLGVVLRTSGRAAVNLWTLSPAQYFLLKNDQHSHPSKKCKSKNWNSISSQVNMLLSANAGEGTKKEGLSHTDNRAVNL